MKTKKEKKPFKLSQEDANLIVRAIYDDSDLIGTVHCPVCSKYSPLHGLLGCTRCPISRYLDMPCFVVVTAANTGKAISIGKRMLHAAGYKIVDA